MGSIYLPYQKPPGWNIDRATIAFNCARLGLPVPDFTAPLWWAKEAYDYSGNQNHGTIVGTTTWKNNGINLQRTGYIDIPEILKVASCTIFIEAIWDGNTANSLWLFGSTSTNRTYFSKPSEVSTLCARKGNAANFGCTTMTANKVFTACLTWTSDGTDARFYFDGVLKGTADGSHASVPTKVSIGSYNEGSFQWSHIIRCCHIFPIALNAFQIQTLHINPYGMFEPIRSPAIWSAPAVGVAPTGTFYGPLYGPLGGPI